MLTYFGNFFFFFFFFRMLNPLMGGLIELLMA